MPSLIAGFTSMVIACRLSCCCMIVPPLTVAKVGFLYTVTVVLTSSDVTVSPSSLKLMASVSVVVTVGVAGEGQVMAMSFGGCCIVHVDFRRVGGEGGEVKNLILAL